MVVGAVVSWRVVCCVVVSSVVVASLLVVGSVVVAAVVDAAVVESFGSVTGANVPVFPPEDDERVIAYASAAPARASARSAATTSGVRLLRAGGGSGNAS